MLLICCVLRVLACVCHLLRLQDCPATDVNSRPSQHNWGFSIPPPTVNQSVTSGHCAYIQNKFHAVSSSASDSAVVAHPEIHKFATRGRPRQRRLGKPRLLLLRRRLRQGIAPQMLLLAPQMLLLAPQMLLLTPATSTSPASPPTTRSARRKATPGRSAR